MNIDLSSIHSISSGEFIKLKHQLNVLDAESSLYSFLKQGWPIIEGKTPFIDGWHIQAISEHLEACYKRQIKNLLINIPPRTGKTNLISVAFPAWVWIHNPEEKFMYASYASSLTIEHSLKCRRLIESDWYQKNWGDLYQLSKDQNAKSFFSNNRTGYRIATSVGGTSTGKGGSILVCFPYNVKVHTSVGKLAIGKIVEEKINCMILSYNHIEEKLEYKKIKCYEKNQGKEILELEFDDGSILECTDDHPIFIEGKGYTMAKNLTVNDIVLSIL